MCGKTYCDRHTTQQQSQWSQTEILKGSFKGNEHIQKTTDETYQTSDALKIINKLI